MSIYNRPSEVNVIVEELFEEIRKHHRESPRKLLSDDERPVFVDIVTKIRKLDEDIEAQCNILEKILAEDERISEEVHILEGKYHDELLSSDREVIEKMLDVSEDLKKKRKPLQSRYMQVVEKLQVLDKAREELQKESSKLIKEAKARCLLPLIRYEIIKRLSGMCTSSAEGLAIVRNNCAKNVNKFQVETETK